MDTEKLKTQLQMISLTGLTIAVFLIFYSAFGDKTITKWYFISGMILAVLSLFLRFLPNIFKKQFGKSYFSSE